MWFCLCNFIVAHFVCSHAPVSFDGRLKEWSFRTIWLCGLLFERLSFVLVHASNICRGAFCHEVFFLSDLVMTSILLGFLYYRKVLYIERLCGFKMHGIYVVDHLNLKWWTSMPFLYSCVSRLLPETPFFGFLSLLRSLSFLFPTKTKEILCWLSVRTEWCSLWSNLLSLGGGSVRIRKDERWTKNKIRKKGSKCQSKVHKYSNTRATKHRIFKSGKDAQVATINGFRANREEGSQTPSLHLNWNPGSADGESKMHWRVISVLTPHIKSRTLPSQASWHL